MKKTIDTVWIPLSVNEKIEDLNWSDNDKEILKIFFTKLVFFQDIAYEKAYNDYCHPGFGMSSVWMKQNIHNMKYEMYIQKFIEWGYLSRTKSYKTGTYTKYFKLFLDETNDWIPVQIKKPVAIKKLNLEKNIKKDEEKIKSMKDEIKKWVIDTALALKVDWDHAECVSAMLGLTGSKREARAFSILQRIEADRITINDENKSNRLYYTFCYCPEEYRECIKLDGQEFCTFDIVNSQPAMAGMYLSNPEAFKAILSKIFTFIPEAPPSSDCEDFINIVLNGNFYSQFEGERKEVKKDVFKYFFGTGESSNQVKDWMEENAPSVHDFFQRIKTENDLQGKKYSMLSIVLQQIEASFVFELVGKRLYEQKIPFVTVHDSWSVRKIDKIKFDIILMEEFEKLGCKMKVEEK